MFPEVFAIITIWLERLKCRHSSFRDWNAVIVVVFVWLMFASVVSVFVIYGHKWIVILFRLRGPPFLEAQGTHFWSPSMVPPILSMWSWKTWSALVWFWSWCALFVSKCGPSVALSFLNREDPFVPSMRCFYQAKFWSQVMLNFGLCSSEVL